MRYTANNNYISAGIYSIKSWLKMMVTFIIMMMCVGVSDVNAEPSPAAVEYQIKAGFICKFVKFVKWPPTMSPEAEKPFVIGVLGDDPFGKIIDDAIKGLIIKKRPFVIRRFSSLDEFEYCHILFVSQSEYKNLDSITSRLRWIPTLTISETPKFCKNGGIINFIIKNNKVRFNINADAAQNCGLEISTALLRMAETLYHKNEINSEK